MPRISVRLRLTIIWGSLFLLTALALSGINYLIVNSIMGQKVIVKIASKEMPYTRPPLDVADLRAYAERAQSEQRDTLMSSLMPLSLTASLIVGVIGVSIGWIVASRALRPLQTVTETARRLSGSNLHERIALSGPRDEIRDLADTFDSMLGRLDYAFDAQRRFVANASHELRTPLSIDRALLQVSLADPDARLLDVGKQLLDSNTRQNRLIEGLLLLAQSERALTVRTRTDLSDLARAVTTDVPGRLDLRPAPVTGDPVLLEQLIRNLVDNARKHNDARGSVGVSTGVDGYGPYVTIANTGQAIPPDLLPTLFEPFRRMGDRTASATGAGLGLSIVRAIAHAHAGAIHASPRPGGGLTVTARLPR